MTDYAAVLELINQVGEDHPQLPFMLKALGVENPDGFVADINSNKDIIPPPEFASQIQETLVNQEQTSFISEESGETYDREKPLWSFPIVVVESYELHDVDDQTQPEKPEHQIKPLDNEPVATDELLQQDAGNTPSLWSKQAVKNGLHQFLEHAQNHQQLDIPKLAVQMAQKHPLGELPFLQTHKLPAELWLYVDKTHGAHCFHDAYLELYKNLQTYVGPLGIAQTVELLPNSNNDFVPTMQASHCHWRKSAKFDEYFDYATEYTELPMPESGVCVIICAPQKALVETAAHFWNEFDQKLSQQRITVLFVPLNFIHANTNVSVMVGIPNKTEQQQKRFLWAALSLIPHRLSLALIRNLRTQFTQLGPDFELDIINHLNVNWWYSQNVGHWFEGTTDYQENISQYIDEFAKINANYENGSELFNAVFQTIESNIPAKLTSFIIEFKVLVLLHAQNLLADPRKQALEEEVSVYYQQAIASIEKAQVETETQNSTKTIIDETQFWLSQALRLNLPALNVGTLPDALKTTVTSAKHHWQEAMQQDISEIPVLDDDYYRTLNKDKINSANKGVLVLKQQPFNEHESQERIVIQLVAEHEIKSNQSTQYQIIANLQNNEIVSTQDSMVKNALNNKQNENKNSFALAIGSLLTLKTLRETINLKAYNSNDFYWAQSIQQTQNCVKATAEQFEIRWRNPNPANELLLQDLFEVSVYDNTPQWLHDFPPQLDKYGIFSEILVENIPFKMRYIPPGGFLMGSKINFERRFEAVIEGGDTQHAVKLTKGFWLAETPITRALWLAVMSYESSHDYSFDKEEELLHPIKNVSWKDCRKFFESLSMMLPDLNLTFPTEAQWEYSCRAGTNAGFHTGKNIALDQANFKSDDNTFIKPVSNSLQRVKSYAPNAWGLYEMQGNISEWCLDGLRNYPPIANELVIDPIGPLNSDVAVIRGGAWNDSDTQNISASRDVYLIDDGSSRIGVRPCFLDGQQELMDRRYGDELTINFS